MGKGSHPSHCGDVEEAFSFLRGREVGALKTCGKRPLLFPRPFTRRNKTMDAFPTRPKLLLDCGLSRSAVQEIVTVKDLIFVVTRSGVCTVFEEGTLETVAQLNLQRDESIRSLFYNPCDESMLTASTYRGTSIISKNSELISVSDIKEREHARCQYLFEAEHLGQESFVEFSADAQVILTYNGKSQEYIVWSMHSYEMLYHFNANLGAASVVQEVLFEIGVVTQDEGGTNSIAVMDSETGENRRTFRIPIQSYKQVDIYDGKLLLHHPANRIIIFDLQSGASLGSCDCEAPDQTWLLSNTKKLVTLTANSIAASTSSGEELFRVAGLQGAGGTLHRVAVGSFDKVMVVLPGSSVVALFVSLASGKVISEAPLARLDEFSATVSFLHLSASNELYVGLSDGKVEVWAQ